MSPFTSLDATPESCIGHYYKPWLAEGCHLQSWKAEMEEFCERELVPYEICGKVISP